MVTTVVVDTTNPLQFALTVWSTVAFIVAFRLYRTLGGDERDRSGYSYWRAARSMAVTGLIFAVGVAWFLELAGYPMTSLGWQPLGPGSLGVGVVLGVAFQGVGVASGSLCSAVGIEHSDRHEEHLRLSTPESAKQWMVHLSVVGPLVAVGEEFLFRGGIVLGSVVALDVSPVGAAVASAVPFGLYHLRQGAAGVVQTAVLGLGFALGYVWTGTIVVPIVAHYVVNVLGHLWIAGVFGAVSERMGVSVE